jgi:hypothetical protein
MRIFYKRKIREDSHTEELKRFLTSDIHLYVGNYHRAIRSVKSMTCNMHAKTNRRRYTISNLKKILCETLYVCNVDKPKNGT